MYIGYCIYEVLSFDHDHVFVWIGLIIQVFVGHRVSEFKHIVATF